MIIFKAFCSLMRRISTSNISTIRYLYSKDFSFRAIAKQMGLSHSTVRNHLVNQEPAKIDKTKTGRPKKLSLKEEKYLVRLFESGELKTTREASGKIWRKTGRVVGRNAIARMLKKYGMKSYAKPKKPRLLASHKKQRLQFARLAIEHPVEDWQRVIFTDESKICVFGPNENKREWRHGVVLAFLYVIIMFFRRLTLAGNQ